MILLADRVRLVLLSILLIMIAVDTIILNFMVEYYENFWPGFAVPIILLISLLGKVFGVRGATFLGLVAITLFVLAGFVTSIPDPEIAKPRVVGHFWVSLRYLVIVVSAATWLWCFLKLHPKRQAS